MESCPIGELLAQACASQAAGSVLGGGFHGNTQFMAWSP